jgi:2-polyprenyl-3-methyl-5-hydroxy-6-metoxy-1,4-benzoquinol methylase
MPTKQQEDALNYFRAAADEWKRKAISAAQNKVNVIKQRNDFVLKVFDLRIVTKKALDVGCGTGDLVCDLARRGVDATGVDFADQMVKIAMENAKKEKLTSAHFFCESIFDFDLSTPSFDLISANGFIEYISFKELFLFLERCQAGLAKGGSLVLGSRNRLFNIFSLNQFTEEELNSGSIPALLKEAIALASGADLMELMAIEPASLQSESARHALTGIKVETRFQFTPIQLMRLMVEKGFSIKQLYPIHIHGVVPLFKNHNPEVHFSISSLLQNYAESHLALIPFSSSFMVHAQKT